MYYLCFDHQKNLSFSSAGKFVSHNCPVHPARTLDSAVLLLGYSGDYPISQAGRDYLLKKGTFQLLFPHTPHYGTAPAGDGQSHFWCHFYLPEGYFVKEANSAEELQKEGLCVLPEFSQVDDCEKYFVLFCQMIDEAERNHANSVICDSYIKILLCSLADNCKKIQSGESSATVKAREWIRLHACEGISARDAAKALHYHPDYLNQLIKADTGMTLSAYLNDIRLREGKNLLLNSDMRIAEIAYATGFADEKYFMKLFRKTESVTPTQYRNAHVRVHWNQ